MHLEDGKVPEDYGRYTARKTAVLVAGGLLLLLLLVLSVSLGAVPVPLEEVIKVLFTGEGAETWRTIILNIRLPQALAAVAAGAGLSVSGAAMQSILRNPLGSPFTLGVSNAAAFGAAFSVMVLSTGAMHSTGGDAVSITNPYLTTLAAFAASMVATAVILAVSRIRRASPEVMILTGVAMGSLFTAGTMFLQYFADDVQLAAMVFWTFGDLARASWRELAVISAVTAAASVYFLFNRLNYNAMDAGDETARGLGVPVEPLRLVGMLVASLVTATIIAFVGVIGFVGLVCPHVVRRIVGDDHRFLIPGSILAGAVLLLAADTAARLALAPRVLPVAVITAFIGAPVFILLLVRGYRR
ncbi:iron chelate uptake ABC transporter family permease subunit [Candidatus Fermentibacteria bacterium]|nr:iron chelate uptake ABC transporter family permease subunit [Candidatus Fermentibacteria bacterium]